MATHSSILAWRILDALSADWLKPLLLTGNWLGFDHGVGFSCAIEEKIGGEEAKGLWGYPLGCWQETEQGDSGRAGDKSWEGQWAARPRSFREAGVSPGGKVVVRKVRLLLPERPWGEVVLSKGRQESTRVRKKGRNLHNRVLIYRTWLTTSVHFQRAFPSRSGVGWLGEVGSDEMEVTGGHFFFLSSLQSVSPQENFNSSYIWVGMDSKYVQKVKFVERLIFQGSVYKGEIALCLDVSQVKPSFIQLGSHDTEYPILGIPFHLVWKMLWLSRKLPDTSNELVISILPREVL